MLLEVTSLLNRQTIDYAVIGGWIPFLFNNAPIRHPGTFDVDIVINSSLSKDAVVAALDLLVKSSGYKRAAKNAFQIYRILQVNDEDLVFHVDFLHRKYADDTDDLIIQWGRYETIEAAGTDVIFTQKEVRIDQQDGLLPGGTHVTVPVPFATEAGFLSCKGRSVGFGKRTRDAFDVFLVLDQSQNRHSLYKRCKQLMTDGVFRKSMERLRVQFDTEAATTQAAEWLLKMAPSRLKGTPAGDPHDPKTQFAAVEIAKTEISAVINEFVDAIGVEVSDT